MSMQRTVEQIGRVGDVDLRLLRMFKAVADSGGFTAAAPSLGISRSAISIHMGELEDRLGVTLCQRGRSGFLLTTEGQTVYDATQRLLAHLGEFRNDLNNLHHELHGELAIGITDNLVTLPHMRITDALASLKDRGSQVHLEIHMMPPRDIEAGVIDGRLHVGVIPSVSQLAALDYVPLYAERGLLYCAAHHPLTRGATSPTRADIARADAVLPSYPLSAEAQRIVDHLNHTATATEREGIAFLVLTGRFVGLLPEHYARRWVDEGRLVALQPEQLTYRIDYYAVARRGRRPNRVLDTFMRHLTEDASPGE